MFFCRPSTHIQNKASQKKYFQFPTLDDSFPVSSRLSQTVQTKCFVRQTSVWKDDVYAFYSATWKDWTCVLVLHGNGGGNKSWGWLSLKERDPHTFPGRGLQNGWICFFRVMTFFYMFYICLHDYFHSNMMFLFGSSKDKRLELLYVYISKISA